MCETFMQYMFVFENLINYIKMSAHLEDVLFNKYYQISLGLSNQLLKILYLCLAAIS